MSFFHLRERIFNKPLLLEPTRAQMILDVLAPRMGLDQNPVFEKAEGLFTEYRTSPFAMTLLEGIAVIPVVGTLVHRKMGSIDPMSKMLSYQELAGQLVLASEAEQVDAILLDIDSGGGEADGAMDVAELIRHIDQTIKPVYAISNSAAFSAAYAIASGARKIFVSNTAGVGSIGVIAEHVDMSKRNEMLGIKITPIFAGDRKADMSPDFPLSTEARDSVQAEVDRLYSVFTGTVAKMRGISVESVIATQAGLFFGANAVSAKLADEVANFDQAMQSILQDIGTSAIMEQQDFNTGAEDMKLFAKLGKKMETQEAVETEAKQTEDVIENVAVEEVAEVIVESAEVMQEPVIEQPIVEEPAKIAANAIDVIQMALDAGAADLAPSMIRDGLTVEQVKERLDVSQRIRSLCDRAGKSAMADKFLQVGLTVPQAQEKLIDMLAKESEKSDVSSKPSAEAIDSQLIQEYAKGEKANPLLADAEKRQKARQRKTS